MKIKLDERYYVSAEKYGYTLVDNDSAQTKTDKRTGKDFTTYREVWYFNDLSQCIKRYCKLVLSDTQEVVSLDEYISRYTALLDRLENLLPKGGVK